MKPKRKNGHGKKDERIRKGKKDQLALEPEML
jgi:hypothetical protein